MIAASAADGLFLDRTVATQASITAAGVSDAMETERTPAGTPLFADTFPLVRRGVREVLLMAVDVARRPGATEPRRGSAHHARACG